MTLCRCGHALTAHTRELAPRQHGCAACDCARYVDVEAYTDAAARLHDRLRAGETLYTLVSHESRLHRPLALRVFQVRDERPTDLSPLVARVVGRTTDGEYGGVRVDDGATPEALIAELAAVLGLALTQRDL